MKLWVKQSIHWEPSIFVGNSFYLSTFKSNMDFRQEFKVEALEKLKKLYKDHGFDAFEYIDDIISGYESEYEQSYKGKSWGQSWRVWKGKVFEDLLIELFELYIEGTNLGLTIETALRGAKNSKLEKLQEQALIHYNKGKILPDSDIILYNKDSFEVLAILSLKTSFRDRISMVGYWSLKTKQKGIKYVFITLDQDNHFSSISERRKKARLIMEEPDGTFVLNENVSEDENIKYFSEFKNFLDVLIDNN